MSAPAGFERDTAATLREGELARWVYRAEGADVVLGKAVLTHMARGGAVEPEALASIAEQLASRADTGTTWALVRHETRRRHDGARVGIIESTQERPSPSTPGERLRVATTQLVFPDDSGTSLVSISLPPDRVAEWRPRRGCLAGQIRRLPCPAFRTGG